MLVFQNSMIPSGLSWEDLLHPLYQKYKNHITWGDQDLLNIIFHYNPGKVPFYCLASCVNVVDFYYAQDRKWRKAVKRYPSRMYVCIKIHFNPKVVNTIVSKYLYAKISLFFLC